MRSCGRAPPDLRTLPPVARKTILICDTCTREIEDRQGATMKLSYSDRRHADRQADLCGECAEKLPGQPIVRRRPRAAAAV